MRVCELAAPERAALVMRLLGGPGSGFHGHVGRPGKVGGSASDLQPAPWDDSDPDERKLFEQTGSLATTNAIKKTCEAFGVPLGLVKVQDLSGKSFTLNGVTHSFAGFFDPRTGFAVMDDRIKAADMQPMLAHELTHLVFDRATRGITPECAAFREFLSVFGDELRDEDGVTPYSVEYWKLEGKQSTPASLIHAVNETLAEMSSLKLSTRTTRTPGAYGIEERIRDAYTWADKPLEGHERPVSQVWREAARVMFKAYDSVRKAPLASERTYVVSRL